MIEDAFGRPIRVLRVSVTDRCDLRCTYCAPVPDGTPACAAASALLSPADIAAVVEAAAGLGIDRVRLTGGEPLVRPDLLEIARRVASAPGLARLSLTTNGQRLADLADPLAAAGLRAVNVSVDALDPALYRAIRRGGSLARALAGIDAALRAGLDVKVNAVIIRGLNESEIVALALLAWRRPVHVRFLEYMPSGPWTPANPDFARVVPAEEVLSRLRAALGRLDARPFVDGDGPAVYYAIRGALGTIGAISAVSRPFCRSCNRIRLLADGRLRPCLFAEAAVDLRPAIRAGRAAIEEALRRAIALKPEGGARERLFALRRTGG